MRSSPVRAVIGAVVLLGADRSACARTTGCLPVCPPGAIVENEANCGVPTDLVNGGCRSPTLAVQQVPRNCVICGTLTDNMASAFDTDTFEFDLPEPGGNVTVTAAAGYVIYAAIDDLNCATPLTRVGLSEGCTPASTTRLTLPAGRVRLMVTSFPANLPCGSPYVASITTCNCPGDMTGDCRVDTADLAVLLLKFGRSNLVPYEAGDLNGDQKVTTADLAIFLMRYGCIGN